LTRTMPCRKKLFQEKAFFCTGLAKITAPRQREATTRYLSEAYKCYNQAGMKKEAVFVERQLKWLKSPNKVNHLKKESSELHQRELSRQRKELTKKVITPARYESFRSKKYDSVEQ